MHLNTSKNLAGTWNIDAPGPSGLWIQQEFSAGILTDGILYPANVNYNVSVQTGEEFSKEFLQDRATSRIVSAIPSTELSYEKRIGNHGNQNRQVAYEELTRLLGLARMDSQCGSDMSEFASAKGSMTEIENGSHINHIYGNHKSDDARGHGSKQFSCDMQNDPPISEPSGPPLHESESSQSLQSSGFGGSDHSQSGKVKFLCSFGGKILPRPSDGKLRYVGGHTRILSIGKNTSLAEFMKKTSGMCNQPYAIKYQLPGEDLDALISVASDEDLQNMIEEYYGLERLGGSQRLRIFLIPLCESDDSCAVDPNAIQQSSREYQYVAAVNGVVGVDPSPPKNCSSQPLTGEANHFLLNVDKVASFEKDSFTSPHEHQMIERAAVPCASSNTNEPQNFIQSPHPLSSISPVLAPQRDLKNDNPPFPRCESSDVITGSPILFDTTELPLESSSRSNSVNFYNNQRIENLTSVPNHIQEDSVLQSSSPSELLLRSHDPGINLMASSLFEQRNTSVENCSFSVPVPLERIFTSEEPLSHPDAPRNKFFVSHDSIGPHYGMSHVLSDSRLQDYGRRSPYCSQEGTSPSSPLHFPTTHLPIQEQVARLQEKQPKVQQNVSFMTPQFQVKVPNVEPTVSSMGMGSGHPPIGSQSLSGTRYVKNNVTANDKKFQPVVEDPKSKELLMENHEENCTSSLMMKDYDGLCLSNGNEFWEGKPPEPLCHSSFSMSEMGLQVSSGVVPSPLPIDFKPSISTVVEHAQSHQMEKELNKILRDESKSSWNANLEANREVESSKGLLPDESFFHGLQFEIPNGPASHEPAIQRPTMMHMDAGEVTRISARSHQPITVDEAGPNLILHDSAYVKKPIENATFGEGIFILGDQFDHDMDRKNKRLDHGECSKEKEKLRDVTQRKLLEPKGEEPPAIVKGLNSVISTGAESSTEGIRHHPIDAVSAEVPRNNATEVTSAVQDIISEDTDFNDDNKDEFLTDAMIAEMEADMYGLQIIRNADLEELRELGSGTYGTVYHAKWRGTDVAIKRIKKTCFSGRSSEQERLTNDFWREAQILSNLHHPNVVAFYGVVPDGAGGTLATVTEFMANGSLRNVLLKKDRSLDYHKKLMITMDAAFGMEYLHSKSIVHFDLKCDNLLVSLRDPQRPVCKVGDFGLSRIKRNTLVSGGVRGTLPWMAPELLNGSSSRVSEKVDVFSFGITMWEILTEEEPYANMHCGAIIGGIVKNTLRPPLPDHCDPEWKKLMEQCWSSDPPARPSFTEITKRLRSISASLRPRAIPV